MRANKAYWIFGVPALLSLIISGAFFTSGFNFIPLVKDLTMQWLPIDEWFSWGGKVEGFLGTIVLIATSLLSIFLYISIYKFVILVLLSPLLAYISEKTESYENGIEYSSSFKQLLQDAFRGIKLSLVNFIKEISAIAILFLLSFIPGLAIVTAPLIFIIQSYFVGFSMIDYFLERRRFSSKESRQTVRKLMVLSIVIGAAFNGLLFIPVLGVLLGPPLAAVAATRAMVSLEEKSVPVQG